MSLQVQLEQPALPGMCSIYDAVEELSRTSEVESRGAIYTRREVVDFILDLVGYVAERPLYLKKLMEPSFGGGDFLIPAIERLLQSRENALKNGVQLESLKPCIRAVELHERTFQETREKVVELLGRNGYTPVEANELADHWLVNGDFLLAPVDKGFDFVIGNPPYVRQELIPESLLSEYRRRFSTLFDRADLYVPFIERSLNLLAPEGQLGFICANRWMKNRYGGPLRELVANKFHLGVYVDMVDTPAFHSDVIAYPAITIIGRTQRGPTRVAERPRLEATSLKELARRLRNDATQMSPSSDVQVLTNVTSGSAPWVLHQTDTTALVRRIEATHPLLETSGCKVGIGVATGADKAFIGKMDELDVEPDRKLPIAMTRDIVSGRVAWRGYGVINPFEDDGSLVDLAQFPKLHAYLEARKKLILERHVAKKAPGNWYRTIDRITPSLAKRPKLLIPDIKGEAQVVYEDGELYPHHNLYVVVSDQWDLRALQGVLLSKLTRLFVSTYSTKMRGGYLRFQAQYLRRIRLPAWESVPPELRHRLKNAAEQLDLPACDEAVALLYQLTPQEAAALAST